MNLLYKIMIHRLKILWLTWLWKENSCHGVNAENRTRYIKQFCSLNEKIPVNYELRGGGRKCIPLVTGMSPVRAMDVSVKKRLFVELIGPPRRIGALNRIRGYHHTKRPKIVLIFVESALQRLRPDM